MSDKPVHVVIVAAGSGSRFGSDIPKQFVPLCGRPVVFYPIEAFRTAMPDAEITLVISPSMEELWRDLCAKHGFTSPRIVYGGATRWESVRNALGAYPGHDTVYIHDGARPLVTPDLIKRLGAALSDGRADGALPTVALTDSIRLLHDGKPSTAVDRSRYKAIQTPQVFDGHKLEQAYRLPYSPAFTDDASVMEAAGHDNIILVEGDSRNIKITHGVDIALAAYHIDNAAK